MHINLVYHILNWHGVLVMVRTIRIRFLSLSLVSLHIWMTTCLGFECSQSENIIHDTLISQFSDSQIYLLSPQQLQNMLTLYGDKLTIQSQWIDPTSVIYTASFYNCSNPEPSTFSQQDSPESPTVQNPDDDQDENTKALEEDKKDESETQPAEKEDEEIESEPAVEDDEKSETDEVATTKPGSTKTKSDHESFCIEAPSCSDVGGGDGAAILFVVIGVFVVVVFMVYGIKYIYDVARHYDEYNYWWELDAAITLLGNNETPAKHESGTLQGFKFASGFMDRNFHIGLAAEIGNLDLKLDLRDQEELEEFTGFYGVLGPAVRVFFSENNQQVYLFLELLTGTTSPQKIRLISMARLGVNFKIYEHLRVGFNVGSLYVELKEDEGYFRERSDFSYIAGFELGFRF